MIMIEVTAELADRLAKLKRRVWQETYTGIYPAQKLLEFDEAQHAEKFRRLIADPANQVAFSFCRFQDWKCRFDRVTLVSIERSGRG